MKHCRAFFNALDDWIRRHPASFEPSGLFTGVWCLLQVTSILEFTEADWKTYLLLPGETNHFTVNHVQKVKRKDDLLDKLKKEKVSILGTKMDAALSNLVSSPEFPFFASKMIGSSFSFKQYLESLKAEVDFTTIRLTPIRRGKNYLKEFKANPSDYEDGSKAKSLILFPLLESSNSSDPKREQSVQVLENSYGVWRPQELGFGNCIFAIVSILETSSSEVEASELDVWRLALARLIVSLDEIMKKKDESAVKTAFDDFQRAVKSNDERWRIIQKYALDFLNEHSKTEHSSSGKERLVFLRPSDEKTKYGYLDAWFDCRDKGSVVHTFLDYADKIKSFFKDDPAPSVKCPTCRKAFGTMRLCCNHRYSVHGYRAKKTSKGKRENQSLATKRKKPQPLPKKTPKVQQVDLISPGPDLSSTRTSEEDILIMPDTSSETDQRYRNGNICKSGDVRHEPEAKSYGVGVENLLGDVANSSKKISELDAPLWHELESYLYDENVEDLFGHKL